MAGNKHRAVARENEALAKHLARDKEPRWPGWIVTVTFYAALHEADAFLIGVDGNRPRCHKDRNQALTRWGDISDPYQTLYRWSRAARYDDYTPEKRITDAPLLLAKVRAAIRIAS